MIPRNLNVNQHLPGSLSWKESLTAGYTEPRELLEALGIDPAAIALDPEPRFPFRVPREFAEKMRSGDIHDPLLRQVLPLADELDNPDNFVASPLAEDAFELKPGLLKKYTNRALVITTGGCAINCRYCFRRNFPYQNSVGSNRFQEVLKTLNASDDIEEIILSGGDPLLLDDEQLKGLCDAFAAITHIRRLRIHTRIPVTIPSRITPALQELLSASRLDVAFVIHANHANEIDETLSSYLRSLHRAGISLFNQSVLLRGVNDCADTLASLCEALFTANVTPYYVHLLDPVTGSAHFDVPLENAREIEADLRSILPGYLMPRFVREIPHRNSKTPLHLI